MPWWFIGLLLISYALLAWKVLGSIRFGRMEFDDGEPWFYGLIWAYIIAGACMIWIHFDY